MATDITFIAHSLMLL